MISCVAKTCQVFTISIRRLLHKVDGFFFMQLDRAFFIQLCRSFSIQLCRPFSIQLGRNFVLWSGCAYPCLLFALSKVHSLLVASSCWSIVDHAGRAFLFVWHQGHDYVVKAAISCELFSTLGALKQG